MVGVRMDGWAPEGARMHGNTLQLFRHAFHRDAAALASAPGRINLIGDHTDYNDGFVLPLALNRQLEIAAASSDIASSRIHSTNTGERYTLSLRSESGEGFARYVAAVAYELRALGWDVPEVDALVRSDIPVGAGLASSAALCVAAATMFEKLTGRSLLPLEKAKLCQRAEHRCGTPCGIMDMFVATHARPGCAMLLDCRSLEARYVPMPAKQTLALFIVGTSAQHALADEGAYASRRRLCEQAAVKLGVNALRDVTTAKLESARSLLTDDEFRCVRHVVTENDRTLRAAEALGAGDVATLGRLMVESHESLRGDFRVSWPAMDAVVALVRANQPDLGYGARMTGAGFGGSGVLACRGDVAADIRQIVMSLAASRLGEAITLERAEPF